MDILFKIFLVIKTVSNSKTAFLDKLGFVNGEVVYKLKGKRIKFTARGGTEDMSEIVVVSSGNEYDVSKIKFPKTPVIFDLGGHIGTFSVFIASLLKNKCRVFSFEPDKDNFNLFKVNIRINRMKSVKVKNLAVSDYNGKGYLRNYEMNTDAYFLDTKRKETNCRVVTLQKAAKEAGIKRVDLLKMDIEGGEYKILLNKSSYSFIKKNVNYIFMEFHNINKKFNYDLILKIMKKDFEILSLKKSVLTLRNLNWKYD